MTTIYVTPQQIQGTQGHMPYVVLPNDQSIIKGAFWSVLALKIGTSALACGASTLYTMPLILLPPLSVAPLACAVGTCVLASLTGSCIDNACYHLGSRNVVVLQ